MDPMAAIRETFFTECEEQLSELEYGLMAMESGEDEPDTVNAVFRAVHSIKGGAGAFSLDALVRYAHVFETTLDAIRSGRRAADASALRVMLRAADVLADLVRAARQGSVVDEQRVQSLSTELAELCAAPGISASPAQAAAGPLDGIEFTAVQVNFAPAVSHQAEWFVRFVPHTQLYASANEAALLLRELTALGEATVTLDDSALPDLTELEPESAYFSWTVVLRGEITEDQIRNVFDFVEDDCTLEIRGPGHTPAAAADDLNVASDAALAALISSLSPQPESDTAPTSTAPAHPITQSALTAAPAQVEQPPAEPASADHPTAAKVETAGGGATIRVDLDRVDRLIDLVGELVINEAMLSQRVSKAGIARASGVAMALDELAQLTREIQDSVMAIRAQPVRSVFQRMPRLVREVAMLTGKSARLVTDGENTEVDKTVIERLADPLTHMIRNAIDHGLESPELRRQKGKPEEGTVRLSALHRSGRIVIEVADDGAGIDRARVKAKAVQNGIIAADAQLGDDEIDNLIFMPGFSTASTISDVSGRGVGMDVVKRSVQALGGRIVITSRPGQGSTFTLSLPLTLAVLDGMVVTVAGHTLIVPIAAVIETLQPSARDLHGLGQDVRLIALRGGYIPLLDVGMALGYRARLDQEDGSVALLVESEGGRRTVLLVDDIQGQRQVVIKSLEANYRSISGVAAATVMGDGRVALILDVDTLVSDLRPDTWAEPARLEKHSQSILEAAV